MSAYSPEYLPSLTIYTKNGLQTFACARSTVPADDLNYVAYSAHLDLIIRKVEEKLMAKKKSFCAR